MSGIRNIKKISNKYKEAEIYFHQDLDGVTSCIAMKSYLERNNIKTANSHIIQYGSLEFNVQNIKEGRLPVIVDFAHIKDMFIIATDHHDGQAGANSYMSTNFKKSSSNVETISNEISVSDIFYKLDIELIKTVDSANYAKFKLQPHQVQSSYFNLDKNRTSGSNRFILGLVVNRLLLSLKNKRISVTSLDKKRKHINRNLLECLIDDCTASIYSLYLNLKHYMNNAISYEWNMDLKTYHDPKKLPSQAQLHFNLNEYINNRKEFIEINGKILKNKEISYNSDFKIVTQYDIGETFKSGSYDRYVVFRNFPDSKWVCTIFKMGLVQISGNPFKISEKNIHLGNITKVLFTKYKKELSNFRISLSFIKKINESESFKLKQKYTNFDPIGFTYNDLISFYKDKIYYLPNRHNGDFTTVKILNIDDNNDVDVILVKRIMNKLYSEWTFEDKNEMSFFKIPGLSILETMSGGHPGITNIQGLNFLDERRDAIRKYFGSKIITYYDYEGNAYNKYIRSYEDLMVFFANEYIKLLKLELNGINSHIDNTIELIGNTSETLA